MQSASLFFVPGIYFVCFDLFGVPAGRALVPEHLIKKNSDEPY